jgi:hypothetical protein
MKGTAVINTHTSAPYRKSNNKKSVCIETEMEKEQQQTPERHGDELQVKSQSKSPQHTADDPLINPLANPVDIAKTW